MNGHRPHTLSLLLLLAISATHTLSAAAHSSPTLMLPVFLTKYYGFKKSSPCKLNVKDPQTETVNYQTSPSLKSYAAQTPPSPPIKDITDNGSITARPRATETQSQGKLTNGSNKPEYSSDSQPDWAKGEWTLTPDTQYNM